MIHPPPPEDAGPIARIYEPFVRNTAVSFETEPPTVEEMGERISKTMKTYPWLVAEVEGKVVGYAYASIHRVRTAYQWSVEVSVYIDPEWHRRGIARSLYLRLFDILRQQGFYNAYAGITLPNPASVGVHEHMGFRRIGVYEGVGHKLGRWHDVGWWELTLMPRPAVVAPPRPFVDL